MPITSYTMYVRDLKQVIDRIRDRPFDYENALIQMAICKNGYGYKCRDVLSRGRLYSEHHGGRLSDDNWRPYTEELGRNEIDEFFVLPEIYAYSDRALHTPKNPLSTAHWDATVAIAEILVQERGAIARRQRMLFVGFADSIHAEFFLAVDHDLVVYDNNPGSQFFEWKTDDAGTEFSIDVATSRRNFNEGFQTR